jgi:hypothetical protein
MLPDHNVSGLVIYDIRHLTLYEYGSTVTFYAFRTAAADGRAGTRVLSSELRVRPRGANHRVPVFFGNRLTFSIETAHRKLIIESDSVEIDRRKPFDEVKRQFRRGARQAFASATLIRDSRSFPLSGRLVPASSPPQPMRQSFPAGRPVPQGATELMDQA